MVPNPAAPCWAVDISMWDPAAQWTLLLGVPTEEVWTRLPRRRTSRARGACDRVCWPSSAENQDDALQVSGGPKRAIVSRRAARPQPTEPHRQLGARARMHRAACGCCSEPRAEAQARPTRPLSFSAQGGCLPGRTARHGARAARPRSQLNFNVSHRATTSSSPPNRRSCAASTSLRDHLRAQAAPSRGALPRQVRVRVRVRVVS